MTCSPHLPEQANRTRRPGTAPRGRWLRAALSGALTTLVVLILPATSWAGPTEDPNLDQKVSANQEVASGERVLTTGHVDLGPTYVDGKWTFLIHDDAAKTNPGKVSVWRHPDQTALHVLDAGRLTVPDDPAYEFLGADVGSTVWVVQQTQNPKVLWVGWNTQDPEVMRRIDRGVTLSMTGVQGPGILTVYLQSGSFGEPQVLWDSRKDETQPVWVDVNTHTHANWVFTEPGVYLVQLTAEAKLKDGSTATDTKEIRFAVGSDTKPAHALAADWAGTQPVASAPASETPAGHVPAGEDSAPLVTVLVGAIAVVALGIILGIVVVVRGERIKRRELAAHTGPSAADGEQL